MSLPPLPPLASRIIEALNGHETRVIGGWVRAYLKPDGEHRRLERIECDLATAAPVDEMAACLKEAGLAFTEEGRRWGSLCVQSEDGETIEVTSLRTDVYVPGSRYPTVQPTTEWEVDAARRDFTINAIYLSPDGTLFDPFNGQTDLAEGRVAFIGEPQQRLSEDPLRWLRFCRFCGKYGLSGLTPDMLDVLTAAAPGLASLSRPRVQTEWERLRAEPWGEAVIAKLRENDLITAVESRLQPAA